MEALDHLGASGIYHHEVFGAHPEQCEGAMRRFSRDLDRLAAHATGRAALGVSPHAPYTVSGRLYEAACALGRAHGVPIAVHVAEPPGEAALLGDFTGIFAEHFRREGIPRPSNTPITPVAFMEQHGVLSERTLCIHAIQAGEADVALMARHGVAVAHCPRSNRFHHGATAPIARYLEHGLRLGLGTDSEISVDPPDLLAEACEARSLAGWDAAATIRTLTLGGAEALALDHEVGSLVPGKWADLVAIALSDRTASPEEAVLASSPADVAGVWLNGRPVAGW
jgi:5-methylthioadenosine/S-adenosylhomocysteine deaminase